METLLNNLIGIGTLTLHIFLALFLIFTIQKRFFRKNLPQRIEKIYKLLKKHALLIAFLLVLSATLLSLIYSEIIGYEACILCWIQRFLIYPQVIILGLALLYHFKDVFHYIIGINITGMIVSTYQYYYQITNTSLTCTFGEISCSTKFIFELGYITIPLMSLTVFILISILTYIWDHQKSSQV
jgi:disulfide bond formation protein DsbB